jgi:hypothetical protein
MTSISVNFTTDQGAVLTDYSIDTTNIYHVDSNAAGATAPIAGHIVGPIPYVLFMQGTPEQHQSYLKALYRTTDTFELEFKGYDMFLYKTPATKHAIPTNLVTVTVAI